MDTHNEVSEAQRERIRLLVSKREAALAFSVSIRTVENYTNTKELAVRKVGRRTLVIAASVREFARRDHVSPLAARDSQIQASSAQ
jgi:hypothetical protein